MPSSLKNDVILVRYPFSDLSDSKVRPAVVVSAPHVSQDIFVVPLTSRTASLLAALGRRAAFFGFVLGKKEKRKFREMKSSISHT